MIKMVCLGCPVNVETGQGAVIKKYVTRLDTPWCTARGLGCRAPASAGKRSVIERSMIQGAGIGAQPASFDRMKS